MRARRLTVLIAVVALAACRHQDQRTDTITREDVQAARQDLSPALRAQIDSGNAAYREKRYEEALGHYRQAVSLQDDNAAAWFGVYMAERALGDQAAADSAMERARQLAPGASIIHPGPGAESVAPQPDTGG